MLFSEDSFPFDIEVFTPMMEKPDFFAEVSHIITLLKKHNVDNIEVFFGAM